MNPVHSAKQALKSAIRNANLSLEILDHATAEDDAGPHLVESFTVDAETLEHFTAKVGEEKGNAVVGYRVTITTTSGRHFSFYMDRHPNPMHQFPNKDVLKYLVDDNNRLRRELDKALADLSNAI